MTVSLARTRCRRQARQNTRFGFHGLRPLAKSERAYVVHVPGSTVTAGAVALVPGYRV